jgi:membrane-associated phospholipid phosphatase
MQLRAMSAIDSLCRAAALCACLQLLAASFAPRGALADEGVKIEPTPHSRLVWNEKWPRFRPIGYALTGASVVGALAVTFLIPYPEQPRWQGGILFDDAARDSLRARSPGMRDGVRVASHITLATNIIQAAVIDSVIIPMAAGSPDVAAQLSLINAQAFSLNILAATLLFKAVARERPLIPDCERNPGFDPLCDRGQYASFPSSHTSTAFTAAGLTCVHHAYLPIYGGAWDAAACVQALAFATATGMFRIIGDRHYASDVLIGAALGFSIGYIYPWLLHYSIDDGSDAQATSVSTNASSSTSTSWAIMPAAPYGMSMTGNF